MPAKRFNATGMKFGRLTGVKVAKIIGGRIYWDFLCDCGKVVMYRLDSVRHETTKSCGCYKNELWMNTITKHGSSQSMDSSYRSWQHMKARCYNSNDPSYKYYGERGIIVCDKWLNDYNAFDLDMGPKPTPEHTIDRINNDGNYEPGNCKWSTPLEQAQNRRKPFELTTQNAHELYMCD